MAASAHCIPVGSCGGYRRQLVPIAVTSGPLNQPPCRDSWRATSRLLSSPSSSLPWRAAPHLTLFPACVSSLLHPLSSPSYDSFGSDLLCDPFTSLGSHLHLPPIHDPHLPGLCHIRTIRFSRHPRIHFHRDTLRFVALRKRLPSMLG